MDPLFHNYILCNPFQSTLTILYFFRITLHVLFFFFNLNVTLLCIGVSKWVEARGPTLCKVN